MAVEQQSGGSSLLYWGRQSGETQITAAPDARPTTYTDGAGKIIHARFPFTQLGLDMGGEQRESATISGRESANKPAPGQIWGEGPVEFEVIPRNAIHILRPSFNSTPNPINTPFVAYARGTTTGAIPMGALSGSPSGRILTAPSGEIRLNKPSALTFTFASALTEAAQITVSGEKRYGLPDEEVVAFTETYDVPDNATTFKTTDYFDSWKTVTLSARPGGTALAAGDLLTITVAYDTGVYRTRLSGFGTGLSNGLTLFGRKGEMPFVSADGYFNNITLTVGDDLRIVAEVLAGSYFNRRAPNTGRAEQLAIDGAWLSDANYPVGNLDFAPAWGSLFKFGSDIVDLTGMTMGINLNLAHRRAYRARRQRGRPRKTPTPRQVTITPTTYFEHSTDANDVFNRWQDLYLSGVSRSAEYSCYNWDDKGKEHVIICSFANLSLTEVPSTTAEDSGDIERPLAFLSVPSTSNPSNELSVEFITDLYIE